MILAPWKLKAAAGPKEPVSCRDAFHQRWGGVFHHVDAVLVGNRHDFVHVGRVAIDMDRHDDLGPRRDRLSQRLGAHAPGVFLDVDEHGLGAHLASRRSRRDPGDLGHDHFITWLYA